MKKTLLITTKKLTTYSFLAFCLCFSYGWSQTNLVLNGTGDIHTNDTKDNADAFDMTPPSELDKVGDVDGTGVASPYKALWNNTDLDAWIGTNFGSNEQPNSTSSGTYDGSTKTAGYKISSNSRRLYQKIAVTANTEYTFSIDSRSEAENIPSEVFILNTEIADEVGLTSSSATVDAYFNISNDYNSNSSSETNNTFTTNTFNFTASGSFVVIYVRSLLANSSTTETFYDNLKLFDPTTASIEDNEFSKSFSVYPNPANEVLFITSNEFEISNVTLVNVMGQKVLEQHKLEKGQLNISKVSKGIYVLKVTSDSKSFSKKIIIE